MPSSSQLLLLTRLKVAALTCLSVVLRSAKERVSLADIFAGI